MKELKHLIYFESLLEDTNNELVRKAESEGDLALGYTCFHAPEVLMNLGNCFSVRLRAPHTNSMELATYYMANNSCEFARALLERALEGNYAFLHAMIGVDVCEANNRAIENMEIMHMQGEDKDKFFYCNLDIPYSDDEDCVEHVREPGLQKDFKAPARKLRHRRLGRRHPRRRERAQRGLPHPHRDRRAAQAGYPAHHRL